MTWHLVFIWIGMGGEPLHANMGEFDGMDTCFEEREMMVEKIGRPIINYQVICVSDRGDFDEG